MTINKDTINVAINMYNSLSGDQIAALTKIGYSFGERMPGDFIRSALVQFAYEGNSSSDPEIIFAHVQSRLKDQIKQIQR